MSVISISESLLGAIRGVSYTFESWIYCVLLIAASVYVIFFCTTPRKKLPTRECKTEPTGCDFSTIKPHAMGSNWAEMEEVPYRPFKGGPYFLSMGLKPLSAEDWIELDKTYLDRLAYKRHLFSRERSETIQSLPGSEDASYESLEMLVDFLPKRYPGMFEKTERGIINLVTGEDWDLRRGSKVWKEKTHPLEVMGLLSTEDWVIMQKDTQGGGDEYHLRAGAVCFPSGWRLAERIGHSLYRIHAGNVPQYEPRIAKSMDRFFSKLKVTSPIQRFNHNLDISYELFRTHSIGAESSEKLTIGDIYLRVERQTLKRLPRTQALLFGIRTYITPVESITKDRDVARILKAQIEAYPEDMAGYKNKHLWGAVVVEHLDGIIQGCHDGDSLHALQ
ncbi:alpha-1,2-mannosyltransferase [Morchella snyderi]|nr:alpha-1,2-mannosyltransferase [Morchella snyderi]